MDYATIKLVHQAAVLLSGLGFAARWSASLQGARWPQGRMAKTLPHLIDTVLLLSAITIALRLSLSPAQAPWLQAKIAGLLVYIGLGMVALRPRFGRPTRMVAGLLALTVLAWMASVAIHKNPWGFLAGALA